MEDPFRAFPFHVFCGLQCCVKLFGFRHGLFTSGRLLVSEEYLFVAAVAAVIKGGLFAPSLTAVTVWLNHILEYLSVCVGGKAPFNAATWRNLMLLWESEVWAAAWQRCCLFSLPDSSPFGCRVTNAWFHWCLCVPVFLLVQFVFMYVSVSSDMWASDLCLMFTCSLLFSPGITSKYLLSSSIMDLGLLKPLVLERLSQQASNSLARPTMVPRMTHEKTMTCKRS